MAKLKRLNRSDRAKYHAKLGNVVREISKSSGIIATKSGETFAINDSADAPISGLRIFGRTDQVKTTGANLFDVHNAEYIESKAYAEVSSDGTLKVASAVNGSYQSAKFTIYKPTIEETLWISFKARIGTNKTVPAARVRYENSTTGDSATVYTAPTLTKEWMQCGYKLPISAARLELYDSIIIQVYSNNSGTALSKDEAYVELKDIMISTSDVSYEPYTGLAPSPSPEYPQKMNVVQSGKMNLSIADESGHAYSSIIQIPFKMRGIPVPSGGNITDENGQQWICDEIDTKSKELIIRIGEAVSSSGDDWGANSIGSGVYYLGNVDVMKNTFAMCEEYRSVVYTNNTMETEDNIIAVKNYISIKDSRYASIKEWAAHIKAYPIKIQYVLAEPIRITLDDVYNLSTLQTYKPTTVVSNDAGAIVELSYYVDKKNYIDQKFAELQALALENK